MELLTIAHRDRPELDMALTGSLLEAVAQGNAPDTIRIFRPGPTLAFGRLDRTRTGFEDACRVARAHGRTPVVRWGGGHAAAYDADCLIIEVVCRYERQATAGLEERFRDMVDLVRRALVRLGVSLELGELPGEYCPGRYSLHLPSGPKVAGVAQRILPRASLTTAVVAVGGANAMRRTLTDVYAALGLPLDVSTAGAVEDQHPELNCQLAEQTLIEGAAARYGIALLGGEKPEEVATRGSGHTTIFGRPDQISGVLPLVIASHQSESLRRYHPALPNSGMRPTP